MPAEFVSQSRSTSRFTLTPSAQQYAFFIVSRIIFGSGLAFCVVISPILLQELPHPSQRVTIAGLFNTNYAVGNFIAAWLCFGCSYIKNDWSWRTVYIIQIIPALYLLLAIHFVPESPRWLMSKGREAEALDFLVKSVSRFLACIFRPLILQFADTMATVTRTTSSSCSSLAR